MGSEQKLVSPAISTVVVTVLIVLLLSFSAHSQTPGMGTWNLVNVKTSFNKNWGAFFEAQVRSQGMFSNFSYHEYKGGIGYNVTSNFNITVAAGQYVTYRPYGNFDTVINSEFRFWQQFTVFNNLGRVKLEHRYRTEQRWLSNGYRNRFRYRVNPIIPLNSSKVTDHTIFISVYDEIFLTNLRPFFERNRLYGGLGYVFNKYFTLQAGILNQYDYSLPNTTVNKNYLQLGFFISAGEIHLGERHPSAAD